MNSNIMPEDMGDSQSWDNFADSYMRSLREEKDSIAKERARFLDLLEQDRREMEMRKSMEDSQDNRESSMCLAPAALAGYLAGKHMKNGTLAAFQLKVMGFLENSPLKLNQEFMNDLKNALCESARKIGKSVVTTASMRL